ncbi:hypothetical protein H8R17_16380 [Streptomyces sp. TRM68367]|nr:hypothetical protein [Streptomyces sp. TRM68367]
MAWRGRASAAVRLAVAASVMGTTAALPGQTALAATSDASGDYAFARDARRIEGARTTGDALRLRPGATYRSSLPGTGEAYYRLELDASSTAYVSATAVPAPGTEVSALDGIKVSLQDADDRTCSIDTETFGSSRSPHPVAAWARREISRPAAPCQAAGTYYVVVEHAGTRDASPGAWDLELAAVTEPRPARVGATEAPEEWDSASPQPLAGDPERRPGGAGFTRAATLGQGVWRDDIEPGRTHFYKVPVDWGQQLYVTAEVGSTAGATGARRDYVPGALGLALYNPVRGHVDDLRLGYDGRQKSTALSPLPPVEYDNRYSVRGQVSAMRFAGSYYLVAHVSDEVADSIGDGPLALTLRVRVRGTAQAGPGYAGESVPQRLFEAPVGARKPAAAGGVVNGPAGGGSAMVAVAVGGIGAGTVLLAGLGVWTAVARRRAATAR